MLQYGNLMTGGVGLYCDVLVAVGFTCYQVTYDCPHGRPATRQSKNLGEVLFKETKNRFLSHLWGLGDNVRTPSMAHWKTRDGLPICHN